jgi:hypothetical protein
MLEAFLQIVNIITGLGKTGLPRQSGWRAVIVAAGLMPFQSRSVALLRGGHFFQREWREDERRRLLDQAATFQRAADAMKRDRDQRAALDTRTEAQRWLGDPPPERSALAQKRNTAPVLKPYCRIRTFERS